MFKENPSMKRRINKTLLLIAICLCCGLIASGQPEKQVGRWEPFEVAMTSQAAFANAYVEAMPDDGKPYVQVTFTGASGDARGLSYTVAGFWDGDKNWKARFAPPAAGSWTYSSSSSDAGLQNVRGTFQCTAWSDSEKVANPARRGFVRVTTTGPRAGRYFQYADGTPFLWIGDTLE
jgi:hypothetical protein